MSDNDTIGAAVGSHSNGGQPPSGALPKSLHMMLQVKDPSRGRITPPRKLCLNVPPVGIHLAVDLVTLPCSSQLFRPPD